MKVVTIIGARPQFIKAATVSRVMHQYNNISEVIVHTGQHFDTNMSHIFFEQMGIPKPDYNLNIASLGHGAMTGRMLEKIEQILLDEQPDWVLVYGDTNSTLAGALAASKLHIKVAHVEAGLRSFNMHMPEEQNRILTDRLSTLLFCPTISAINNLHDEGYLHNERAHIIHAGDVMYDAALFYQAKAQQPESLATLNIAHGFVLATMHRAENTDDKSRLSNLVEALNTLHQTTPVVLPLHPRTKQKLSDFGLTLNVHLIEPVGYLEMVYLLMHCDFVASDSGGVQKEAFFFDKHCLILRDETEWTELVDCGANYLVGADVANIVSTATCLGKTMEQHPQFYGTGQAAQCIVETIAQYQ